MDMSKLVTPQGVVFEATQIDVSAAVRSRQPQLQFAQQESRDAPSALNSWRQPARKTASRSIGLLMAIGVHLALALAWYVSGSVITTLKMPEAVVLVDVAAPEKVETPTLPKVEPPKLNVPLPVLEVPEVSITAPAPNAPRAVAITSAPPPAPSAPAVDAKAIVETFQLKLLRHLNRYKRYPAAAKAKREQGVAYVHFTMDRAGRVLSARLEKTSGFTVLDTEAVALLNRAQPLPPPPHEVQGNPLVMVVPVEFFVR